MRSFTWLRARPRTLASIGVVSAAAVTLGILAFTYEGKPTTEEKETPEDTVIVFTYQVNTITVSSGVSFS